MAGTEGQRSLLVLSDGADTSDTPIETATAAIEDAEVLADVVALEQYGRRPSPRSSSWPRPARARSSRPTRRPCRRRSPPRPTCWPARCWSPRRCPSGFEQDRGHHQGHAADVGRLGHRRGVLRRSSRRPPDDRPRHRVDAAVVGAVRRPGGARPRPGPAGRAAGAPQRKADSARPTGSPSTPSRRAAGRRGRRPLLDTDVTFASAKETAANVLRRNKDLDARISRRLAGARAASSSPPSGCSCTAASSSSPAWSACCSAAATC